MNTTILSKANEILRKKKDNKKAIEAENQYRQVCIDAGICHICGKELIKEERKATCSSSFFGKDTAIYYFLVCNSSGHHFEYQLSFKQHK